MDPLQFKSPLDDVFGVENAEYDDPFETTTEGALVSAGDAALVPADQPPEKDEEDKEIDRKIDEVYDSAMNAFNTQTAYLEIIEPRYAARNAEVAANYLNIALQAANSRAKVKSDRKRSGGFIPFKNNQNPNGTVVATREEIMRMISVDTEHREIK
jgi:hypothetical protein